MKIRKLFKKAAALALAAVTALSVMPAQVAFAAGDIGTIPVLSLTAILRAAQEITSTVCMWMGKRRSVSSLVSP